METYGSNWTMEIYSPTHTILGFLSALNQHASEGGVLRRLNRYEANKNILVEGMRDLGFETLLSDKWISPIIVSFLYPADENFNFEIFYNLMKNQNFIIYPGKLTVAGLGILTNGELVLTVALRFSASAKPTLEKFRSTETDSP